jgi:hypothetical protein
MPDPRAAQANEWDVGAGLSEGMARVDEEPEPPGGDARRPWPWVRTVTQVKHVIVVHGHPLVVGAFDVALSAQG